MAPFMIEVDAVPQRRRKQRHPANGDDLPRRQTGVGCARHRVGALLLRLLGACDKLVMLLEASPSRGCPPSKIGESLLIGAQHLRSGGRLWLDEVSSLNSCE